MTATLSPSCLHCDRPVDGAAQRYCPHCGQPTPPHRIDWHFLGHELEHSVLHMDRGLLFTLRELVLRPGRLLRDYLAGRRHGHARPLLLIGLSAGAVVLAAKGVELLHPQMSHTLSAGGAAAPQAEAGFARAMANAARWFEDHYALVTLLLLPLEAACFRAFFGRRAGLNYPEWLVVIAFITVQAFLLQLVMLAIVAVWPHGEAAVRTAASLLVWLVSFLSLRGLFATWPAWRVALSTALAFLAFMVLTFAITSAVAMLVWR